MSPKAQRRRRARQRKTRSQIMASIHSRDTGPEVLVRRWLFRHGVRFRKCVQSLPGTPDVVLTTARVALFVHGCFWHQHPGCPAARLPKSNVPFWQEKFRRNVERDERVREQLRFLGWRTMVVWECQLEPARLEATMTQVARLIAQARLEWQSANHRSPSYIPAAYDPASEAGLAYAAEDRD